MGVSWTYYQTKEVHDGGQCGYTTKLKSFMMGVSWTYYQTKEFHDGGLFGRTTKLKSFMMGVSLDVLPN